MIKHARHGHNCHDVAVDVFMQMAIRHRWEEIRDYWPDDYKTPPMDVISVDKTWLAKRSFDNMNFDEAMEYRSTFLRWRYTRWHRKKIKH